LTQSPTPTNSTSRRAPSIKIAFQTLGRTIRHGYDNLGTLLIVALLWFIGALFVLPLGPATAGMHRVIRPMTEERATHWRRFFEHLRPDMRWSSALAFALLLGFILLQGNISFYNAAPTPALRTIAVVFGAGLFIWIGVALFAFPLALRQDEPYLRKTLRNAIVMVLANAPGVLISYGLLLVLLLVLAVIPPLFILIPGVVALWGQEQARLLLVASGHLPKDDYADKEDHPFTPSDDRRERKR
jgi:uncharacterized membrane protein YesL